MPDIPQDAVRDCIKSYLKTKGLTYQYLADRLGIKIQSINNYLSTTPLSRKTVGRIAEALDYPEELLLRGERYYGPELYQKLEERIKRLEEAVFGSSNPDIK